MKIEDMSERLTTLTDSSVQHADMTVCMDKAFTHHVQVQETQKVTTQDMMKVQKKFKYQCGFCTRHFKTKTTMYTHRVSCPHNYATTEKAFEVECTVGVFGRTEARWYLVKCVGHDESEWNRDHLPESDGCRDSIRALWTKSGLSPCQEIHESEENKCEV